MAGLQRSVQTFRRSGSSGLVWDQRFLSGDPNQMEEEAGGSQFREHRQSQTAGSSSTTTTTQRRRSDGGRQGFCAGPVAPAFDPPSPDVSACGLCGIFGKPWSGKRSKAPRRR